MFSSNTEKPIAFSVELARLFGSNNASIYWQQLNYWSTKGQVNDVDNS